MTPRRHAARGFTLMEVLISLVLLSLLMLMLTGAIGSMGQTEERVEQRVAAAEDYRTSVDFLSSVLHRVSARKSPVALVGQAQAAPFFEANSNSLAWVGVMPARYGVGGRHYLRLAVESSAQGGQLVLRYAPWTGAATFSDWGSAAGQVLAAPVSTLSLRYQNPATGQWGETWPPAGVPTVDLPPDLLPAAVEVQLDGPTPAWPPLVVSVTPTRASDTSAIGAGFGGGGAR